MPGISRPPCRNHDGELGIGLLARLLTRVLDPNFTTQKLPRFDICISQHGLVLNYHRSPSIDSRRRFCLQVILHHRGCFTRARKYEGIVAESAHLPSSGPWIKSLIGLVKERKQAEDQLELACVLGVKELDPTLEKELREHAGELRVLPLESGEGE